MKKLLHVLAIICSIILIVFFTFQHWSTNLVAEAAQRNDVIVDISRVADGIYNGHSELGPVIVDVTVSVQNGKIANVKIIQHQNGLGQAANSIVTCMTEQNTYDVDTVSGATVSSEIIINAVINALQKGLH